MMAIAKKEGLQLTDATMRSLVEGANGDLRLILGQLQMIRLRTAALSYDDAKKHGANSKARPAACAPQYGGVSSCFQSEVQVQMTLLTSDHSSQANAPHVTQKYFRICKHSDWMRSGTAYEAARRIIPFVL